MIEAPKNVLIVGGGAREHALGWKMRKDSLNTILYFAPGNGGTAQIGRNQNIDPTDIDRLVNFSVDNEIELVVVGPERPLANGLTDALSAEKVNVFGLSQAASFLEADKAEAALFMLRYGIPQPNFHIFTDHLSALDHLTRVDPRSIVIKASGLADGKGVVLPRSEEEAIQTIRRMIIDRAFGEAGRKILIQKRLEGEESSVMAFVSEKAVVMLPTARDYKRLGDGDTGPNTG